MRSIPWIVKRKAGKQSIDVLSALNDGENVKLRSRFGDTESSYTLHGSKTSDTIDYDVAGDFAGDLKIGYMSTYKDLNLGMSCSVSAGDAGRRNHSIEMTMRVDF